ncbi:MAG: aldehyde dehydrogenase EutE, partial [Clostridia bacterium]|nr:aldehyde dehydrogenase EutE [Clostridia bacterium]
MAISEAEIRKIVEGILNGTAANTTASAAAEPVKDWSSTQYKGRKLIGIFDDMNEAIEAADKGYRAVRAMTVEQREKIITVIRRLTREEAQDMA